jgi:predicted acetyltransferase
LRLRTQRELAVPILVEPSQQWESAYLAFLREFADAGEEIAESWRLAEDDFARFLAQRRDWARGLNLPEGYVPESICWLVSDEGEILGQISVRHRLTPALEDFGGHVGYQIRPSQRGKGYGTTMLALALDEARRLGLGRVLITCDPDNVASARVIEKNGGVLASRSVAHNGRLTSRYWIDLEGTGD